MKFYIYALAIITILLSSCNRENNQIPYAPVDFTIYISDPQWINLSVPGGWEYVSGGSKGIILFRTNLDEIMAYERHCPYQPDNNCKIHVDSSWITATDTTCCGTTFNLYNGSVTSGVSTLPLKAYQTIFDGEILRVIN